MTALTVQQACDKLRITRRQLARLIARGQLTVCVHEEDLTDYIQRSRVRPRRTP